MNYGKFGSYCYAPHMLKNWEVSGFGLTQQNRTRGGNYGEGEKRDLRSYTFFFSPKWDFPFFQGFTS